MQLHQQSVSFRVFVRLSNAKQTQMSKLFNFCHLSIYSFQSDRFKLLRRANRSIISTACGIINKQRGIYRVYMPITRYENEASKSWQENDSMNGFNPSSLSAVNVLTFNLFYIFYFTTFIICTIIALIAI